MMERVNNKGLTLGQWLKAAGYDLYTRDDSNVRVFDAWFDGVDPGRYVLKLQGPSFEHVERRDVINGEGVVVGTLGVTHRKAWSPRNYRFIPNESGTHYGFQDTTEGTIKATLRRAKGI